jgi:hypothetical protein
VTGPPGRVDLHTHTRRSDGVLEPAELLGAMRRCGMRVVAITDHDTLDGVRELLRGGRSGPGMPTLIAGVEINTAGDDVLARHGLGRDGTELHILGYGVDPADPRLDAILARQRAGRRDRIALLLERLAAAGMSVQLEPDELAPGTSAAVGRPHVARALVRRGYATSVDDAFARFVGHGGTCYVPRQGIGAIAAIEAITAAGGLPVLAHAPQATEQPEVVGELMDAGLRGLEVHYRSFDEATVARMAAFAADRGLLPTGGSDYHGDTMDYTTARAGLHVPDTVGERLLEALAR